MSELPLYQIVDYEEHFENYKSKARDRCSFVCVPNKHGGTGLSNLLSEPYGHGLYGIWMLLLQLCSRQRKPRAGYLTANGRADGRRLGAEELAHTFRCDPAEMRRCLDVVSSSRVGFIRLINGIPEGQIRAPSISNEDTEYPPSIARNESAKASRLSNGVDSIPYEEPEYPEGKKEGTKEPPSVPQGGPADIEDTKKWFNSLFGRQRAWSYEEDQLLLDVLPIDKADRALLSWAYTLPKDREGWALVSSQQSSKPKDSIIALLREFSSEVDKWRSVRVRGRAVQKKNGAEPLPPEWAEVMRRLYGAEIPVPPLKSQLAPSVRDEIEATLKQKEPA